MFILTGRTTLGLLFVGLSWMSLSPSATGATSSPNDCTHSPQEPSGDDVPFTACQVADETNPIQNSEPSTQSVEAICVSDIIQQLGDEPAALFWIVSCLPLPITSPTPPAPPLP
jgi:hypothetical protein